MSFWAMSNSACEQHESQGSSFQIWVKVVSRFQVPVTAGQLVVLFGTHVKSEKPKAFQINALPKSCGKSSVVIVRGFCSKNVPLK